MKRNEDTEKQRHTFYVPNNRISPVRLSLLKSNDEVLTSSSLSSGCSSEGVASKREAAEKTSRLCKLNIEGDRYVGAGSEVESIDVSLDSRNELVTNNGEDTIKLKIFESKEPLCKLNIHSECSNGASSNCSMTLERRECNDTLSASHIGNVIFSRQNRIKVEESGINELGENSAGGAYSTDGFAQSKSNLSDDVEPKSFDQKKLLDSCNKLHNYPQDCVTGTEQKSPIMPIDHGVVSVDKSPVEHTGVIMGSNDTKIFYNVYKKWYCRNDRPTNDLCEGYGAINSNQSGMDKSVQVPGDSTVTTNTAILRGRYLEDDNISSSLSSVAVQEVEINKIDNMHKNATNKVTSSLSDCRAEENGLTYCRRDLTHSKKVADGIGGIVVSSDKIEMDEKASYNYSDLIRTPRNDRAGNIVNTADAPYLDIPADIRDASVEQKVEAYGPKHASYIIKHESFVKSTQENSATVSLFEDGETANASITSALMNISDTSRSDNIQSNNNKAYIPYLNVIEPLQSEYASTDKTQDSTATVFQNYSEVIDMNGRRGFSISLVQEKVQGESGIVETPRATETLNYSTVLTPLEQEVGVLNPEVQNDVATRKNKTKKRNTQKCKRTCKRMVQAEYGKSGVEPTIHGESKVALSNSLISSAPSVSVISQKKSRRNKVMKKISSKKKFLEDFTIYIGGRSKNNFRWLKTHLSLADAVSSVSLEQLIDTVPQNTVESFNVPCAFEVNSSYEAKKIDDITFSINGRLYREVDASMNVYATSSFDQGLYGINMELSEKNKDAKIIDTLEERVVMNGSEIGDIKAIKIKKNTMNTGGCSHIKTVSSDNEHSAISSKPTIDIEPNTKNNDSMASEVCPCKLANEKDTLVDYKGYGIGNSSVYANLMSETRNRSLEQSSKVTNLESESNAEFLSVPTVVLEENGACENKFNMKEYEACLDGSTKLVNGKSVASESTGAVFGNLQGTDPAFNAIIEPLLVKHSKKRDSKDKTKKRKAVQGNETESVLSDNRYTFFLRRTMPSVCKSREAMIEYVKKQRIMLLQRSAANTANGCSVINMKNNEVNKKLVYTTEGQDGVRQCYDPKIKHSKDSCESNTNMTRGRFDSSTDKRTESSMSGTGSSPTDKKVKFYAVPIGLLHSTSNVCSSEVSGILPSSDPSTANARTSLLEDNESTSGKDVSCNENSCKESLCLPSLPAPINVGESAPQEVFAVCILDSIPPISFPQWSEDKKSLFKYAVLRKKNNFDLIKVSLSDTPTSECILQYYLSKNKTYAHIKRRPGRISDLEVKTIVENEWSLSERQLFLQYYKSFGKKWYKYQDFLNKTEKDLKMFFRYYSKYVCKNGLGIYSRAMTGSRDCSIGESHSIPEISGCPAPNTGLIVPSSTSDKSSPSTEEISTNDADIDFKPRARKSTISKWDLLKQWTIDERQLFAIYFPFYNKNWIVMATYFPNKGSAELRQYYNRYFKRLSYNEQKFESNLQNVDMPFSSQPVKHVGNGREEVTFCDYAGIIFDEKR